MSPIRGIKRFVSMVFRRYPYRIFGLLGTKVDYLSKVGDGTGSSTVVAPLNWTARTFPEAPPALYEQLENGEKQVRDHAVLRLLRRPNDHHTGPLLWMATVTDWMVDGNAYWLKLRDGIGVVRQLWWVPSWMIEPKGDPNDASVYIDHYAYKPDVQVIKIAPEDVVHFRNGLDPDDHRVGRSQLKSVLREVYTDDEAAAFTASLLRNMGVPGLVVSPEPGVTMSDDEALDTKTYIQEKFAGDRRGDPLVMTGATKVQQFGFSPEQLLLRELRRIPEERVTAVMGIPAIVAGLGAGLDRSTFTNMAEAREAAYESGIIPMQRILAEEVLFQLVAEFEDDPFSWRFGFDLSKVRVLQEDLYRQVLRHGAAVRDGWERVDEARQANGLTVEDSDKVYLRPANAVEVPADGGAPRPLAPTRNGNGNGFAHASAPEIAAEVVGLLERNELIKAR